MISEQQLRAFLTNTPKLKSLFKSIDLSEELRNPYGETYKAVMTLIQNDAMSKQIQQTSEQLSPQLQNIKEKVASFKADFSTGLKSTAKKLEKSEKNPHALLKEFQAAHAEIKKKAKELNNIFKLQVIAFKEQVTVEEKLLDIVLKAQPNLSKDNAKKLVNDLLASNRINPNENKDELELEQDVSQEVEKLLREHKKINQNKAELAQTAQRTINEYNVIAEKINSLVNSAKEFALDLIGVNKLNPAANEQREPHSWIKNAWNNTPKPGLTSSPADDEDEDENASKSFQIS